MPKTTKSGKAIEDELPSTLQRSDQHAKQVFAKTYDSAIDQYDDEQRAHQTAFASLKHTHEKVGDHWEPKEEFGPSDAQAEGGPGLRSAHRRRRGRQCQQEAPLRARQPARHQGPVVDDQGRTRRSAAESQRPGISPGLALDKLSRRERFEALASPRGPDPAWRRAAEHPAARPGVRRRRRLRRPGQRRHQHRGRCPYGYLLLWVLLPPR